MSTTVLQTGSTPIGGGAPGTPTGASSSVAGSVTGPVVGAIIAQTPSLSAGTYAVIVTAWASGPVAAADMNNLSINGAADGAKGVAGLAVANGVVVPIITSLRITLAVNQRITVTAIVAGTAGAVYSATIAYTPET